MFSPALNSFLFEEQKRIIQSNKAGINDRDIVTSIFVYGRHVIIKDNFLPHLSSEHFYKKFGVNKNAFTVILLGKDGEEKLRKTGETVSEKELFSLIDSMPMRQREMKQRAK